MRRMLVALSLATSLLGCASARGELAGRPTLTVDVAEIFDCDGAQGDAVVLLHADWGGLVVAAAPFDGAIEVGRIEDGTIHLSVPGMRMPELQFPGNSSAGATTRLWARSIATTGGGGERRSGCAGMEFTEDDVLFDRRLSETMARIAMGGR